MKRVRYFLIIFFWIFLIYPKSSFAQGEFAFDIESDYRVAETGLTHVNQQITITNLVTDYYATNYTLSLTSDKIEAVAARDATGPLNVQVTTQAGQTVIKIDFPSATVGIGQQVTFDLSYVSRDNAIKKGRIWEIIIPGIEKTAATRSYITRLMVPDSFGKPAYFSPPPSEDGTWTLDQLGGKGITAAFGDVQVFNFNLIYHLQNTSGRTTRQEITLPPDTAYQKVILSHLSEVPENVVIDRDGNWLAAYRLEPDEIKKITAEGSILVYVKPENSFRTTLTDEQIKLYTQEQKFWERTPQIQELAKGLTTPKAIYEYVVETLDYSYDRIEPGIERLGAPAALAKPDQAVCMEFSDLFVALSRSAGIPARELHGFAYTTNSRLQPLSLVTDVLHAWAEYYDPARRVFVPVDPTWGNTTKGVDYFTQLDFNHITFAILGTNSSYPYPAGSFRRNLDEKTVYVEFSEDMPEIPAAQADLALDLPQAAISGRQVVGSVVIRNRGQTLYQPKKVVLQSASGVTYQEGMPPAIPPYGHTDIDFTLSAPRSFFGGTETLTVTVDGFTSTLTITTLPFFISPPYLITAVLAAVAAAGLIYVRKRDSVVH